MIKHIFLEQKLLVGVKVLDVIKCTALPALLQYFSAYKTHQRIGRIPFFMQIFLKKKKIYIIINKIKKNNFSIFYHAFIE
jgi:hypothetical protein